MIASRAVMAQVASRRAVLYSCGTPIVRVPWNEAGIIGRVLDAGARGVIIPMVNSVAEAQAAVAACKYPPLGASSFGPILVAPRAAAGEDYFGGANDATACIPMIETRQAVEALDDILAIEGVDAMALGRGMARDLRAARESGVGDAATGTDSQVNDLRTRPSLLNSAACQRRREFHVPPT